MLLNCYAKYLAKHKGDVFIMPKKYIYNPMNKFVLSGYIFRKYGMITMQQIYNNVTDYEMISDCYFKIPKNAVIKNFKIITTDADDQKKVTFSQVIEHHHAQRMFDELTDKGGSGVLLKTLDNNICKMTVGRQLIAARTEIHITYYYLFDEEETTCKMTLPLAITEVDVSQSEGVKFVDEIDYKCELDLEIINNVEIVRMSSETHEIAINQGDHFTKLNFQNKNGEEPVDELKIAIEYYNPSKEVLSYDKNNSGHLIQELKENEAIELGRSRALEFIYYGQKIREIEERLPKFPAERQIESKEQILKIAKEHNILCSLTSFCAENEHGERGDVPAVHRYTIPIKKSKKRVFDSAAAELAAELGVFANKLAGLQRSDGFIADDYEHKPDVCASFTALSVVALISYMKRTKNEDKYLFALDGRFWNKSVDCLLGYLARGGKKLPEIKFCFKYLLDNFLISGQRAAMVRKIIEKNEKIDNIDISGCLAICEKQPAYEISDMVKMLLKH